jgi:hypothetical protein
MAMITDPGRLAADKAWRQERAKRTEQGERAERESSQHRGAARDAANVRTAAADEVARFKNALQGRQRNDQSGGETPVRPESRFEPRSEPRPARISHERTDPSDPRPAGLSVSGDESNDSHGGASDGESGDADGSGHSGGQRSHDDAPAPGGIFGLFGSVLPAPASAAPAVAQAPVPASNARTIAELAERVLVACDATREVRVQVRPDVMPGVAFSVAQQGGRWLVQFDVADPTSLGVLQDASERLSTVLAERLGQGVELRVTATAAAGAEARIATPRRFVQANAHASAADEKEPS